MRAFRLLLLTCGLLLIGSIGAGCGNLVGIGSGVSCVVQADGLPNCFGANGSGQAGHAAGTSPVAPGAVALPAGLLAGEISVGTGSATGQATVCVAAARANSSSGKVYCWGDDAAGQLGRGSAGAASAAPVKVPLGAGNSTSTISVGGSSACAISGGTDYGVLCWGSQLTTAGMAITAPLLIPGTTNFRSSDGMDSSPSLLSVGRAHACAGISSQLVCWGMGTDGQLGNGASADSVVPVTVALPATIDGVGELSAGGTSTCVVATDKAGTSTRRVWCWGANDAGQLGNGTMTASNVPIAVTLPDGRDASHVGVGARHACAVASDSTVWCWGANESGQLGNGTTTASAVPVRVSGFQATLIGAGQDQSCASDVAGHLRCWGSNAQGQLGQVALGASATPRQVPGIDGLRDPKQRKVVIRGTAAVGSTLRATTAPWPYAAGYDYQWQRLSPKAGWIDIPKADRATLRLAPRLAGAKVRVSVTGKNAWTAAGVVMSPSRASAARVIVG